ncbi:hypothetical protein BpJC4_26120 [Weizmannia acidilactici]|nr:hypothetical protein BpJC4_26120 [Weizmannia acidilactici]GER74505.1 hypothetical protein BpPP18_25720 [Weizmannia acidilactici]
MSTVILHQGQATACLHSAAEHSRALSCYDIRFPEWVRKIALRGAKTLFVPAEWPLTRLDHWRTLCMARAIENQFL